MTLSLLIASLLLLSCIQAERSDPDDLVDQMNLPYYTMATWFLDDLVQRSYLYDLEDKMGITFTRPSDLWEDIDDKWEDYTVYFIGYTLCLSVGVVLIIAMPFIGCIVACCRCCGNCGGGKPSDGQKPSGCKHVGCGFALLIITAALGFGAAGMFIANESLRDRLDTDHGGDSSMFNELQTSVYTMDKYTHDSMDQLNSSMLGQYTQGVQELNDALHDLPNNGLDALDKQTNVVKDMTELTDFTDSLSLTSQAMGDTDVNIALLNGTLTELAVALENVTGDILIEIQTCTDPKCAEAKVRLNNLMVGVNTNGIDFSTASSAITTAINDDVTKLVNSSAEELNNVKEDIAKSLETPINDISTHTAATRNELVIFIGEVNDIVTKIDFKEASDAVEDAGDAVKDYYTYVYASMLTLGIIICITLLCNVMGVLFGIFCPRPLEDARSCQCDTTIGSQWLIAGLVFTFVFYWLYTLIVASMFVSGGVTQTEFCRHAVNYETDKSQKVLDIFDRIINTTLAEKTGVQLEVFSLYDTCQTNESFYEAFDIADRGYNVTEVLDMSSIKTAVHKVGDTAVIITAVDLMNQQLTNVLNPLYTELSKIEFDAIIQQLTKPLVTEDIAYITSLLKELNNYTLDEYIKTLEDLQDNQVEPAAVLVQDILVNVSLIRANVDHNISALITSLQAAETEINGNGSDIVQAATKDQSNSIADDVAAYATAIDNDVTNNVGNCYPFFDAFTIAIDATCVKTLYPFNSFWYSLGWILFFFIPSIILSFCLITEYQVPEYFTDLDDLDQDDAFTSPHADHVLIPQPTTHKTYANEFDNPMYNESAYHIPRPSLKSKEPKPDYDSSAGATDTQSNGSEFRLPRPKVYGSDIEESPPSYHSIERNKDQKQDYGIYTNL